MASSSGNIFGNSFGGSGSSGVYGGATRVKSVLIPSGGSSGSVSTRGTLTNYSPKNVYHGNAGSGSGSLGSVQGGPRKTAFDPYQGYKARRTSGFYR
ncbi:hypothetical protein N431DRAFT_472802 [Stipitochalara longipes BDJ]|nr:hypothetical protein N431DRAFT_472802 [Stipitochalara longipes BDJ]